MADQPGYTRIPNHILDAMCDLGNAELRVLLAIVRKTHGWQKECDVISFSQFQALTGLTRRNAFKAVEALEERGMIVREKKSAQSFCYSIKPLPVGIQSNRIPSDTGVVGDTVPLPVGIQSNRIPSDTGVVGDTVPLPVGIRLEEKPLPLRTIQKKDLKKDKEREGSRVARTPPPKQTNLDNFNEAVAIFKELSGKKHITPALMTLIATRVTDMSTWRTTIESWAGCGYNLMNVQNMLDWYDHPEKMAAKNGHTNGKLLRQSVNGNSERKPQRETDLDNGF